MRAIVASFGLAAIAVAGNSPAEVLSPNPPAQARRFEVFDADSLKAEREKRGDAYYRFLDRDAISAGIYHLAVGATDDQEPHRLDEVYYVLDGAAQLSVAGRARPVSRGDVHFVRAGVAHHFHDITEALDLVVVFSKTPSAEKAAAGLSFGMSDLVASRSPTGNEWNAFLRVPSMVFGLYMLPQALGGDADLTHETEELNIVVAGAGTFDVSGVEVPVGPGQIVFVERGAPHRFRDLTGDLDVLILWNR